MVNVTVCVGSSCHLKGAGNVVKVFQSAISERGAEDTVSLNGSFCMGECIHEGVSVKIDGELF
ncbi:MAG: (2Fe-2S) ferredoxin domain-containing protein, partial [Synergistaceae bacterium]|nr:(2Fe-2S) ferredoxin domain-containing protein [Synergistaceae bacterium]